MQILKQSTAASRLVGPILAPDGTPYTSALIGDMNITKNGTSAAMAAAATLVHSHNGFYVLAFITGNTDTIGALDVSVNKAGYSMTVMRWSVVYADMYDFLMGTGLIDGLGIIAALRIIAAACAGEVSGAGTGTEVFKGLDGSTTRLTVAADASGNRTACTY